MGSQTLNKRLLPCLVHISVVLVITKVVLVAYLFCLGSEVQNKAGQLTQPSAKVKEYKLKNYLVPGSLPSLGKLKKVNICCRG
jgi:hypothetical protein